MHGPLGLALKTGFHFHLAESILEKTFCLEVVLQHQAPWLAMKHF